MGVYLRVDEPVPYLCFTANTAGSTVQLTKTGSPTSVTLEKSTDGSTRTTYTIGSTITLSNIGDKVYFRNTSETTTGFSTSSSAYYKFVITGSIEAGGDITYLINKNGSINSLGNYCFYSLFKECLPLTTAPNLPALNVGTYCYGEMFYGCENLTTAPALPATTISNSCYIYMFRGCTNLETLPNLPATLIWGGAYEDMFYQCSKIKLSETQTGEYQTPYRIPTNGTATTYSGWNSRMFDYTGGTFTSNPSINTTYYTSNTVV